MFRRLSEPTDKVRITIDGRPFDAAADETVAGALLRAGLTMFRRTPKSGCPRGPFCGMGVCFDCLVTIDGQGNRQACLTQVRDQMMVETGARARRLSDASE